jgi:tRNA G10  N-methylase Trm11
MTETKSSPEQDILTHYYFKLKHNIQNDSELDLARLEVEKLMQKSVRPIRNFIDVLSEEPLKDFLQNDRVRPQDFVTRLPYPGILQGYYVEGALRDCSDLIRKLAYYRDFYVLVESGDPSLAEYIFPQLKLTNVEFTSEVKFYAGLLPYAQVFTVNKGKPKILFRFIPLHTLYEPSDFICRLAWKIEHVDRMFEESIRHFQNDIYRAFSPSSARWFKKIGDFIDEREAPQLYLTHYIFGIRGKFFPRMISAIMNAAGVKKGEWILDPFCGCGTMNVEACIRGVNSIGIDMQPLFTMITDLKIKSMSWSVEWLKTYIQRLLSDIQSALESRGQNTLSRYMGMKRTSEIFLPNSLMRGVNLDSLEFLKVIKGCILNMGMDVDDPSLRNDLQNFCKLPLAYWMRSMLKKQSPEKIFQTYAEYLWKMFFSVYYVQRFRKSIYNFELGEAEIHTGDVRKLDKVGSNRVQEIFRNGVDGIITSPPYGTALDYVGEHVWALYALNLTEDHLKLDEEMHIGTHRVSKSLAYQILEKSEDFQLLPEIAQKPLVEMAKNGREQKASAFFKYFVDMLNSFKQMSNVLKQGKMLIMIIGKQQLVKTEKGNVSIELGRIMEEMGMMKSVGLKHLSSIDVALQKASERGAIPTEHVIFFEKP